MDSITELESAVQKLTPQQLAEFRIWFAAYDAEQWDRQFEEDVAAGRLESMAAQAIKDYEQGRCSELLDTVPLHPSGSRTENCRTTSSGWRIRTMNC
jgi:hypothetical protein